MGKKTAQTQTAPMPSLPNIDPIKMAQAAIDAATERRIIAAQGEIQAVMEKYEVVIVPTITFEGGSFRSGVVIRPR